MAQPLKYLSKDYVIWGSLIHLVDKDQIWQAIDKRVRTSVRKGQRLGVKIRPMDIASASERATVTAFTPNADDIPAEFTDRYHPYVATDEISGEILGWILLVDIHDRKLFMLCHASTPAGKERQTPNLLLWHVIETWCGGPFSYLDVGGSYRGSLQTYFSGFRQQQYPMILQPPELPMDIRISPFDTQAYAIEPGNPDRGRQRLAEAFGTDQFTVLPRATYAIAACLRELLLAGRLTKDDEALVATTTDTPYISGCVTRAIEMVCQWSQTPSDKTRAVFMIHEFGFPNPRAAEWRAFCDARQIPLIEDLAYGWGTDGLGRWGDYRIYSATKIFPLSFGGFLVGMDIPFDRLWSVHQSADAKKQPDILALMDAHWQDLALIRQARQTIWQRYADNLKSVSQPYFALAPEVLPGAYIAKMPNEAVMKQVMEFVRRFGIEVGSWYHHSAIFLPCHQRLSNRHVDFIAGAVMTNFREYCGVPGMETHH